MRKGGKLKEKPFFKDSGFEIVMPLKTLKPFFFGSRFGEPQFPSPIFFKYL